MNKFVFLALALFATVAKCSPYDQGPIIQQVSSLPNVAGVSSLLGSYGAGRAQVYAPSVAPPEYAPPAYAPPAYAPPAYAPPAYAPPSYAAVRSYVAPSVPIRGPSYASGPVASYRKSVYSAPVLSYNKPVYGSPQVSYNKPSYAAPVYSPAVSYEKPSWSVRPVYSAQLNQGPTQYKAYRSQPTYSTVALPVLPSAPVAKLFVPERKYGVAPY